MIDDWFFFPTNLLLIISATTYLLSWLLQVSFSYHSQLYFFGFCLTIMRAFLLSSCNFQKKKLLLWFVWSNEPLCRSPTIPRVVVDECNHVSYTYMQGIFWVVERYLHLWSIHSIIQVSISLLLLNYWSVEPVVT